jgi:outer membrane protein assembly factor BamA
MTTMPIIEADASSKMVSVIFPIKLSYKAKIKNILISGNRYISTSYIENRLRLKEGEYYNLQILNF